MRLRILALELRRTRPSIRRDLVVRPAKQRAFFVLRLPWQIPLSPFSLLRTHPRNPRACVRSRPDHRAISESLDPLSVLWRARKSESFPTPSSAPHVGFVAGCEFDSAELGVGE